MTGDEFTTLSEELLPQRTWEFQRSGGVVKGETGEYIATAETFYGPRLAELFPTVTVHDLHAQVPAALWAFRLYPPQTRDPIEPQGLSDEQLAQAVVNHGRWLVHCPLSSPAVGGKCYGAQHAAKTDPRFYCTYCLNDEAGHAWLPVVWPSEADEIERELLRRPYTQNRNWRLGETVGFLQREREAAMR